MGRNYHADYRRQYGRELGEAVAEEQFDRLMVAWDHAAEAVRAAFMATTGIWTHCAQPSALELIRADRGRDSDLDADADIDAMLTSQLADLTGDLEEAPTDAP